LPHDVQFIKNVQELPKKTFALPSASLPVIPQSANQELFANKQLGEIQRRR